MPVEMSRFFDERVDGYDSHMKQCLAAHFDTFYAAVADAVEPTSSEIHLLDLGCGTGAELKGISPESAARPDNLRGRFEQNAG